MGNLQVRFLEGWAPAMAPGYSTLIALHVPLALAGGGSFTAEKLNLHARTNIDVITKFLPVKFVCGDLRRSSPFDGRNWLLQHTRSTTAMKERMVSLTLVPSSQLSVNLEFFAFRVLIT